MYRTVSHHESSSGGYGGKKQGYKWVSIPYKTKKEAEENAEEIRNTSSAHLVEVVKDGEE